jgi:penicillin amidase
MATLQNDDLSLPALQLQTLVRSTPLAHEAELAGFLRWDGRLRADSTDAALYEVWLRQICLRLGAAVFPADGERYSDLSPRLALAMLGRPEPALFGSEPTAGRDRLLIDALRAAQQYLAQQLGPDMAQWSWGRLHTMRMRHPLDQQPGAMALMDPGPVPRPGDGFTVNATDAGKSWEQVDGASYRQILDAGDWDRSIAINTPGQSGQPSSAHYADLLPLWAAGQYFPLSYSRAAVEANTTDRLLLLP